MESTQLIKWKPQPQPQPNSTLIHAAIDDDRDARVLNKLKASIFTKIKPSTTITPQLETYIHQQLLQIFPTFETPFHPTYASMIRMAISELNKKEGPTEEEISEFIKRKYDKLPWGHERFLRHHLMKLCREKDIDCVNDGHYVLLVNDCGNGEIEAPSGKKLGRRRRRRKNTYIFKKQKRPKKRQTQVIEDDKDLENWHAVQVLEEPNVLERHKAEFGHVLNEIKEQSNVLDEHYNEAERTEVQIIEQQIQPLCQDALCTVELSQQKDQMTTLERDVGIKTFNKEQKDGRDAVTDRNCSVLSLKEMRVESVSKKQKFDDQPSGFPLSLKGMESNSPRGKRRGCLKEDKLIQKFADNHEMKSHIEGTDNQIQNPKQEEESRQQIASQGPKAPIKLRFVLRRSKQTTSPCKQNELVCGLRSPHHFQPKNPTDKQMVARSFRDEFLAELEQHAMKNTIRPRPSHPQQRGRGRPPRLEPETNKITPCNQEKQLESQGNGMFSENNTDLAEGTPRSLSSSGHDSSLNKEQQLPRRSKGRPRKSK